MKTVCAYLMCTVTQNTHTHTIYIIHHALLINTEVPQISIVNKHCKTKRVHLMPGVLSHWETIVCKLRTESVLACEWNTIGNN